MKNWFLRAFRSELIDAYNAEFAENRAGFFGVTKNPASLKNQFFITPLAQRLEDLVDEFGGGLGGGALMVLVK